MPLNRKARIENITKVEQDNSKLVGTFKLEWNGVSKYENVYRIPIEYLVYNKYNGRILSRIKSLETQNKKINIEIEEDFQKVESLLFASHPTRNRQTESSIRRKGQEKPGIITKDGIVIDGNRRFMFLNRIVNDPKKLDPEKFKYFEAVILPVTLEDAPNEIRRLETSFQMGEDKKLDYNPIEKYLKAQELIQNNIKLSDISEWMGESVPEIKKYLSTIKTMDDYLDYLDYDGIYTQLDGREDWFLSLTKWINNFRGKESDKPFEGHKESDIDNLERICYDYIRAKHGGDGKRFRKIAEGLQSSHIFGNKTLWVNFKNHHDENIEPILDNEVSININARDLKSYLDDRDKQFTNKAKDILRDNLNDAISALSNKQNHDKPEKLIKKASGALSEVNTKAKSFSSNEVQNKLKGIVDMSSKLLSNGNISLVMEQALNWLESINLESGISDEEKLKQLNLITKINKTSFNIKKELGG